MKRHLLLSVIALLPGLAGALHAQKTPVFTVKAALSGAFHTNYKMALECRIGKRMTFELSGSYRRYNPLRQNAFQGILINEYALRRTYYKELGSNAFVDDTGWQYFGSGRPVDQPAPASVTPLSTTRLNLGWRNYFATGLKGVQFIAQPAVSVALYQSYKVEKLSHHLVNETRDAWRIGSEAPENQAITTTLEYEQQQRKEVKYYWLAGPAFVFGCSWHAPKGIVVETRWNVGLNIGNARPEDSDTIRELKPMYDQLEVMIGYCFGK